MRSVGSVDARTAEKELQELTLSFTTVEKELRASEADSSVGARTLEKELRRHAL